jgi:cystathionine beta-lyase/cystathionine gamma-synthase
VADKTPDGITPQTRLVTAGRKAEWTGTPGQPGAVVNPPVWRASTHLYADSAALKAGNKTNADGTFFYGRRGAPTQWALADALTELEPGAAGTMLYPSGVAAIAGVGDVTQHPHLRRIQRAIGHRDAQHVGVELQVEPVLQPQRLELVLTEMPFEAALHLVAKFLDAGIDHRLVVSVVLVHQTAPGASRRHFASLCGSSARTVKSKTPFVLRRD